MSHDTRGGIFYLIAGERIREDELTPEQRNAIGLPPSELPAPSEEPATVPAPVTTDA